MTLPTSDPRTIWDSGSWQLRAVSTQLSDGRFVDKAYINHPGAVVLVPIRDSTSGLEILMLRQYRLALGQEIFELPAGTREVGEPWLDCAQRELREETGYRAAKFQPLGRVWPAPGISNELMAIYLAEDLTFDPLPQDSDEVIEVQPMLITDLVEMVNDGQIQDAKSCIGILRAALYMNGD